LNLFESSESVKNIFIEKDAVELSEYWNVKVSNNNKLKAWIDLVDQQSKTLPDYNKFNVKELLTILFL
jgi:hypothetical protein